MRKMVDVDHSNCRATSSRLMPVASRRRWSSIARHLLWEWGLNSLAVDTELLVSELVTNAVRATAGQQQAAIRLRLSSGGASVLVEVWDAGSLPPAPKELAEDGMPDLDEEGGRGL